MKKLLGLLVVFAAMLFTVAPAAAAEGRIDDITSANDELTILFSSVALNGDDAIDPSSVAVTVDDQPVESQVAAYQAGVGAGRVAILTLDVSGSMKGAGIAAAKDAADLFLGTVPADVRVGLVTFGDTAKVAIAPTEDHDEVAAKVAALEVGGDTALYDGVVTAVRAAGEEGSRSLIVLSDGKDEGSSASLKQAQKSVASSGVGLDAVALGDGGKQAQAALGQLAKAGSGQVFSAAAAAELEAAFAASASSLESQLQITAALPAGTGEYVSVSVSAEAGSGQVSDSAITQVEPIAAAATPVGPQAAEVAGLTALLASPAVALGALLLVFAGLLVVLLIAFRGNDTDGGRVGRRLRGYGDDAVTANGASPSMTDLKDRVARSAVELAGRVSEKRGLDQTIGLKLEAGGVALKPAEWLLILTGATVVGALVGALVSGFGLVGILAGGVIGFAIPYLYLSVRVSSRRKEFDAVLAETLTLVAGSLSAGHSIQQAFDTVVRESDGVMRDELGRALAEARLGVPFEDALTHVAERMDSEDFRWVVMAITVQREIGGDLAEVLRNVADMLRERERLRRQVKTLSAEGRLSAFVLIGLPIAMFGYMMVVRPEYISLLFTTTIGLAMSLLALLLLVVGSFWMSRIIKIEV
jgi:tight adherence protein B